MLGTLMRHWAILASVVSALALLSFSAQSQDLRDVTLRFLQRHGVPCSSVTKVNSPHGMDEVAICDDGREWALFWLEDEIAFVHPRTRELYRWQADVYRSQPQLYGSITVSLPVSGHSGP